jgi:hypothetical protein
VLDESTLTCEDHELVPKWWVSISLILFLQQCFLKHKSHSVKWNSRIIVNERKVVAYIWHNKFF